MSLEFITDDSWLENIEHEVAALPYGSAPALLAEFLNELPFYVKEGFVANMVRVMVEDFEKMKEEGSVSSIDEALSPIHLWGWVMKYKFITDPVGEVSILCRVVGMARLFQCAQAYNSAKSHVNSGEAILHLVQAAELGAWARAVSKMKPLQQERDELLLALGDLKQAHEMLISEFDSAVVKKVQRKITKAKKEAAKKGNAANYEKKNKAIALYEAGKPWKSVWAAAKVLDGKVHVAFSTLLKYLTDHVKQSESNN
jgi:hypothetical protein